MNPPLRDAVHRLTTTGSQGISDDPLRIMIVDDSAFVRGIVARWIGEERGLTLVASHSNGCRAVDDVARSRPDLVILDVEMPEMDGLTALPLLLEKRPGLSVIMASTSTHHGAEACIRALTLGATDYMPKPDPKNDKLAAEFRNELFAKIRGLGAKAQGARRETQPAAPAVASPPAGAPRSFRLRPQSMSPVRVLVIGSSTGGPQALTQFFSAAGKAIESVPVLVTQHMPPIFTTILAEHIAKTAGRTAAEGVDGETVRPGQIYVAPGDRHMTLARSAGATIIRLSDSPPVNFCRPAVDPLFQSAADIYGSATLGILLTGTGSDGANGATAIADAGGSVIAQDEPSSVVWGMPGAAVEAGACSEILPLAEIGPRVAERIMRARR